MTSKYDKNRLKIGELMKTFGIDNMSPGHKKFCQFILDPINSIYLQDFFIICSGYMSFQEAKTKLLEILDIICFKNTGYTYRDIFFIDREWEEFYKENAYPFPSGQRKSPHTDPRRGVDKDKMDQIMKIKRGPPEIDLEQAILQHSLSQALSSH
jgi:hypothetical protein